MDERSRVVMDETDPEATGGDRDEDPTSTVVAVADRAGGGGNVPEVAALAAGKSRMPLL